MRIQKPGLAGLAAILVLGLGACATTPETTTLADGSVAFRVNCDGASSGMNYCFERAGKSCGAEGYSIVDSNGRVVSSANATDSDLAPITKAWQEDQSSILVRCGS